MGEGEKERKIDAFKIAEGDKSKTKENGSSYPP